MAYACSENCDNCESEKDGNTEDTSYECQHKKKKE